MRKEDKIKIENSEYEELKNELFNLYFVENVSKLKIKNILQLTTNKVNSFLFKLNQDPYFINIIKINDYFLRWCDNEDYPTACSFGVKGYSNKYNKFTYRILNYKQLKS